MLHHNERIRADFSDLDTFFDREKEWLQDSPAWKIIAERIHL